MFVGVVALRFQHHTAHETECHTTPTNLVRVIWLVEYQYQILISSAELFLDYCKCLQASFARFNFILSMRNKTVRW